MMSKYASWHPKGESRVGASTSPAGPLPPSGLCRVGHANRQHRQSPRLSCPSSARHRNLAATSQACNACPVPWELHTHCRPSAPACFSLSYRLVLCPPAPEDVPLHEDSQPSSDASDPCHPGLHVHDIPSPHLYFCPFYSCCLSASKCAPLHPREWGVRGGPSVLPALSAPQPLLASITTPPRVSLVLIPLPSGVPGPQHMAPHARGLSNASGDPWPHPETSFLLSPSPSTLRNTPQFGNNCPTPTALMSLILIAMALCPPAFSLGGSLLSPLQIGPQRWGQQDDPSPRLV